jgi:hypothetical protein
MKTQKIGIGEIWKIRKDVNELALNLSKGLANKAKQDMVRAFNYIITDFYKKHDPEYYNRTYNLRNTLISNRTYSMNNNKCRAIINVGSSKMNEYNNRTTSGNVYNLMWIKGVRGLPKIGTSGWVNPAWSGEGNPYHNIFNTSIIVDEYTTQNKATPHNVMADFINNWGIIGINECNKIVNKII